jgi:hypothetical protein
MTNHAKTKPKSPIICVHPSADVLGSDIFNPNSWSGGSKAVLHSCQNEYWVLCYCVNQISDMCADAMRLCEKNIMTLQMQWQLGKFPLEELMFYAQQPDLHIRIEAFLSGVKSLLDLLVQLISTEKIVGTGIDGFHRDKDQYGGRVLNALKDNAIKGKKEVAAKINALISKHKNLWIDQVIMARDLLVHPQRGRYQLKTDTRVC